MAKNRYPGLRSFEEEDEMLFFGRDKESAQLASIIYAERFVVLFGNSGVGKSSLLNTLYKKNEIVKSFQPIRIRIQANQKTEDGKSIQPLEIVKDELEVFFEKQHIAFSDEQILFDQENATLWEWIKLAETLQAANNLGVTFVLVFDQFEEYFSLPQEIQNDFSCQLAEIIHELPPTRILDWMAAKKDEERTQEQFNWYHQVTTRVVFSIRSDKLYHMGRMVDYIPVILRSRMELKHFDPENAQEAIEKPGLLEGDFLSPKIVYLGNITKKITEAVTNDTKEVDSSLLQVICYYVEETIITKNTGSTSSYQLTESDFDTQINLDQILENFYLSQTAKFADPSTIEMIRSTIEDYFVENGERVALSEQQLVNRLQGRRDFIPNLISYRLIREELIAGRKLKYELIHDKLIATVQRRKDLREKERKIKLKLEQDQRDKNKWTQIKLAVGMFLIVLITAVVFYFRAGNAVNDTLVNRAVDAYNNNNQFLAYCYIDGLQHNIYIKSSKQKNAITSFNHKFLYDISGGNKIEVIDQSTFAVYHSIEQMIYIWKADEKCYAGKGKLTLVCILDHALNMIVSKEGHYVAFRNTKGIINVYDIKQRRLNVLSTSKVKLSSIGNKSFNGDGINDYKMAFLENSSWLAFIDDKLNFKLYNSVNKTLPNFTFLKVSDEYHSEDVKDFFFYSPGTNYIATKKPKRDIVKLWDMGAKIRKIETISNVQHFFATSRRAEFAYLTKDNKVYSRIIDPDSPPKQIAENVLNIIPFKNGSKVILIMKKELRVYDFNREDYDKRFEESNKLFIRLQKHENQIDSRSIKWSAAGRLLIEESVVVDLDKVESSGIFIDKDYAVINDSASNNCINSDAKDQMRIAYVNQNGFLIVKRVGSKVAEKSWRIATKNISSLKDYYFLDQLCKFSSSGQYFAFIRPEKEDKRLTIVDLFTGKETVQDFPVKIIGTYFTDKYIQVISDFNTAGGLVFLNQKKRNNNYYENIFPISTIKNKNNNNFN